MVKLPFASDVTGLMSIEVAPEPLVLTCHTVMLAPTTGCCPPIMRPESSVCVCGREAGLLSSPVPHPVRESASMASKRGATTVRRKHLLQEPTRSEEHTSELQSL